MEAIDYEVAGILLEFHYLIAKWESPPRRKISFQWGATRKRSAAAASPSTTSPPPPPSSSSTQSSSLQQSQPSVPVLGGTTPSPTTTCEIKKKEKGPKALSPTTPLLFLPSEPDEKTQKAHSKRNVSLKRKKREENLRIIEDLPESNRILRDEIKELLSYWDREKAINLKLKAALEDMERRQNQQALLPFDLNTPPLEECFQMELRESKNGDDDDARAALAAQARRRRIQIRRSNKTRSNNKLRRSTFS